MNDIALLDQESKKAFLNEDALNAIKNAKNPHILLINGTTRHGKSTTLNQLIRGYKRPHKYKLTKPFRAGRSDEPITRGCSIYGPIKLRTFLDNCGVLDKCNEVPQDDDTDIFLADTEGFKSLDNITSAFIPAILTMIQCSTLCVFLTKGLPDQSHVGDIKKHALLSNYMERFLHVKSPQPLFFVTDFKLENEGTDNNNENDVNNDNQNEEEDDDDDDDDEQISRQEIIDSLNRVRQEFKISVKQKIQENIESDDSLERFKMFDNLDVDISGPFYSEQRDIRSDSPYLEVYWNSLQDIAIEFSKAIQRRGKEDGEQLCNMIKALFDAFNTNSTIPDNETELDEIIKSIIQNIFNEQIKARYNSVVHKMEGDIILCKDILSRQINTEELLEENIDPATLEMYCKVIEDAMNAILASYALELNEVADSQIKKYINQFSVLLDDDHFPTFCTKIIDDVRKCQFKEDVKKPSKFDILGIYNQIVKSDKNIETVVDYLKQYQESTYQNYEDLFINKVNLRIKDEFDKLPQWEAVKNKQFNMIYKDLIPIVKKDNSDVKTTYLDKHLRILQKDFPNLSYTRKNEFISMYNEIYYSILNKKEITERSQPEELQPPEAEKSWWCLLI